MTPKAYEIAKKVAWVVSIAPLALVVLVPAIRVIDSEVLFWTVVSVVLYFVLCRWLVVGVLRHRVSRPAQKPEGEFRDSPIKSVAQDRLGRVGFSRHLAAMMLDSTSTQSRTISVEGSWGEGKSSAVEMALDIIGAEQVDPRPFVVRLNPWQFATKDSLVNALLAELANFFRSNTKFGFAPELASSIEDYAHALSLLRLDPSVEFASKILPSAVKLGTAVLQPIDSLEEKKARVQDAVLSSGRSIVVVIDDVDRLLPPEVVEVVRFVRAVGDFASTTYVLAYDHKRVAESLSSEGIKSPDRFLEKIVQQRIHLPPVRRAHVRESFELQIAELKIFSQRREFDESGSRRVEVFDYCVSSLLRDLRTVSRLIGRLRSLPPGLSKEVEFWDLVGLNTIALASPELFELIRTSPLALTGKVLRYPGTGDDEKKARARVVGLVEAALTDSSVADSLHLRRLIASLFPYFEKWKLSREVTWFEARGRIATYSVLSTALNGGLTGESLSLEAAKLLISNDHDRSELLNSTIHSVEDLVDLCELVKDELQTGVVELQNPAGLAHSIARSWQAVWKASEGDWFRDSSIRAVAPTVALLISRSNDPFLELRQFATNDGGPLLSEIIDTLGVREPPEETSLGGQLTQENVDELTDILREKLLSMLVTGGTMPPWIVGGMLYSLKRVESAKFEGLVDVVIGDSTGRRNLMRALTSSIFSSADGPVAKLPDGVVRDSAMDALRKEAKLVLKEDDVDSLLKASATAIDLNKEIVVSSGLPRS